MVKNYVLCGRFLLLKFDRWSVIIIIIKIIIVDPLKIWYDRRDSIYILTAIALPTVFDGRNRCLPHWYLSEILSSSPVGIYFQDSEQDPGKSRVCFTTMMWVSPRKTVFFLQARKSAPKVCHNKMYLHITSSYSPPHTEEIGRPSRRT